MKFSTEGAAAADAWQRLSAAPQPAQAAAPDADLHGEGTVVFYMTHTHMFVLASYMIHTHSTPLLMI